MTLDTEISWPAAIPLPLIDYSGGPRNGTIVSDVNSGAIERRSRFERSYAEIEATWRLTGTQYVTFKAFFSDTLGDGTAQFKLELRYPNNSVLTEWAVRFLGGYAAQYLNGMWEIKTTLDVINPVVF